MKIFQSIGIGAEIDMIDMMVNDYYNLTDYDLNSYLGGNLSKAEKL